MLLFRIIDDLYHTRWIPLSDPLFYSSTPSTFNSTGKMDEHNQLSVVILAAGKGTRMKSDKAKVLHEVFYAPMVHHVIDAVTPLLPARTIVIVGHQQEAVIETLNGYDLRFVTQQEQLGTGHAVLTAEPAVPALEGVVMILCGDTPLIRPETLQSMYRSHIKSGAVITLMTTLLDNPTNYGRIISDDSNRITAIVEEKDTTDEQKKIREINAGIYCVDRNFLFEALKHVGTDNSQGEVYLTDIVAIGVNSGKRVEKFTTSFGLDVLGVNSRVELAEAHDELRSRRNRDIMMQGVTMQSPATITVSPGSTVGKDTLLSAGTQLLGKCRIGEHCTIGNGVILKNCTLGDGAEIQPYCVLQGSVIEEGEVVAPHTVRTDD